MKFDKHGYEVTYSFDSENKLTSRDFTVPILKFAFLINTPSKSKTFEVLMEAYREKKKYSKLDLHKEILTRGVEISYGSYVESLNFLEKEEIIKFSKESTYNKTIVTLNHEYLINIFEKVYQTINSIRKVRKTKK